MTIPVSVLARIAIENDPSLNPPAPLWNGWENWSHEDIKGMLYQVEIDVARETSGAEIACLDRYKEHYNA
jgi:hypothetical protein